MPDIDIGWTGYSVYAPGSSFGPYTTTTYEFVWIDHGGASFTTGGERHALRRGSVVLSAPGERNVYDWSGGGITRHGFVLFTAGGPAAPRPRVRRLPDGDAVLATLRHIRLLDTARPPGWEELARTALSFAVLAFAVDLPLSGGSADRVLPAPIERSILHVSGRWSAGRPLDPPTLDELAAAAGVTPEHLCRVYRKELGYGPLAALRMLRLSHAATLLARSNLTIAQVARATGFTSPFHFSRAFKAAFDRSPTEFRGTERPCADLPDRLRSLAAHLNGIL
jgi:AraC-like DNA-binding protein